MSGPNPSITLDPDAVRVAGGPADIAARLGRALRGEDN
jgi:hypothetical protein